MRINRPRFFIALAASTLLFIASTSYLFAAAPSTRLSPYASPAAGRMQACQVRLGAIKTRSESLLRLATTMQKKFDAIAGRVETYYTTKLVPEGKAVAKYDTLVAMIQTKKDAVATELAIAQNDVSLMNCTGPNPKADVLKFNQDIRSVKTALGAYRTAIKDLIVGVRSKGTNE
jgi:hypothetical protein